MAFKWDTYFETGIPTIDEQHRGLVDIINEAAPLLTSRSEVARGRFDVLMDRLFDYAAVHFKTEESIMAQHGLRAEYCDEHQALHRDFVNQLIEFRTMTGQQPLDESGPTLLRFLTGWLTFHILDEDQRMARQIRLITAGSPPSEAQEKARIVSQDDHARTALVVALLDLYAVVGERNRTLYSTNETLKRVSKNLELANIELEQRVDERTRELREILERMERTQGQLLQSEKMAAIGQLAAGVAHEINNPIGFVNSNLGSLKKYVNQLLEVIDAYDDLHTALPVEDSRRQRVEKIRERNDLAYLRGDIVDLLSESEQGLTRVRKIVQDLKDFSHVDDSGWQDTDLNAGLESTLNVVWAEIKYKAEVVKEFGNLPPVPCFAAQINQVMMNLLVNAAQAIDGRGTITLKTAVDGQWAVIEIADTGKGMTTEVQQRIFEPFFTTKPVGQGTGLGLSISWDIVVKKHGGQLTVDSAPGKGTKFRIALPITNHPASDRA